MKLRHALAGTVALPLALAVASANAATIVDNDQQRLNIGGFVVAQAYWEMPDEGETNYGMDLGTSRINVMYTQKTDAGDITYYYEQNIANNSLRHAAIMWDGWVAGQTWSGFANLTGLGETLDANGNAITSSWAARNALLGKNIDLGDGMSVGVFLEDRGQNSGNDAGAGGTANASVIPDLTANFKGNFGGMDVFFAGQLYNVDDATDATDAEQKFRLTAGLNMPLNDQMKINAAFTSDEDNYNAVSGAFQMKLSEDLRTNVVFEHYMDDGDDMDYSQLWLNAIHTTASGWEWGGEFQMVFADDNASVTAPAAGAAVVDGDMTFRVQARYAF
ncbi:hypothetical protein SAMN05660443_2473 [Marinospirillum celere]|uniref:Porin n=1 Tax=Marinospirillum celere TaxID=1122252 RepID=A0A1I1IX37_9GAMM|nr:hypothetical protein [Marinospirillum celere]SFC38898.1 hypothetical protein SAMN05660443_2473 [Marinospirillum celere]